MEDPAAAEGMGGEAGEGEGALVLTLAALQREYAVVRGHRALAAAMPGGRRGHASLGGGGGHGGLAEALRGGDAEGVFAQLLALGGCGQVDLKGCFCFGRGSCGARASCGDASTSTVADGTSRRAGSELGLALLPSLACPNPNKPNPKPKPKPKPCRPAR